MKWLIRGVRSRLEERGIGVRAAVVALAVTAFALATAFSGCGGGGEGSTTARAQHVRTPGGSTTTTSTNTRATTTRQSPPGNEGHPASVQQTVNAVLTRPTPENCTAGINHSANVTERYVRVAYGDIKGCIRAQAQGAVAKSLTSYTAHTDGDNATVTVRAVGGPYDGEKLTVQLVREGDSWKVDGLKSNAPVGP
jgi:hypothetical protein